MVDEKGNPRAEEAQELRAGPEGTVNPLQGSREQGSIGASSQVV